VHVLDEQQQPVALGAIGELYIGGAGVARGYIGRPDLTAERFLPNPFGPGRLYRTGDLARWRSDGELDWLGRLDQQIKLRGYRIEPAEIEAVLCQHPQVSQAVVSAHEVTPGETRLVAHLVTHGAGPSTADLRAFVRERLPEYMVPTSYFTLSTLPLTPNGKLDRAALPLSATPLSSPTDDYQPPRGPFEQRLATMMAELLGVATVSINDNFFEMGGHSLLGAQLIARIRDAFSVEVPLRLVFESPTVGELSAEIERLVIARIAALTDAEAERLSR
jgi:acyl carrier protein